MPNGFEGKKGRTMRNAAASDAATTGQTRAARPLPNAIALLRPSAASGRVGKTWRTSSLSPQKTNTGNAATACGLIRKPTVNTTAAMSVRSRAR